MKVDTDVEPAGLPGVQTVAEAPALGAWVRTLLMRYAVFVVLLALVLGAALSYSGFMSTANWTNILTQNAPVGLIAVGMTFVIIAGGFDISVGAEFAFCATFYAGVAINHSAWLAGALTIVLGLVLGSCNGALVTLLRVNPFIATLATASIFAGMAQIYSNNAPMLVSRSSFTTLGMSSVGPVPISVIILVVAFVVGGIVLHKSVFGRSVYAVGGNAEASRLSGTRVRLIQASTYSIVGVLAGVAGMITASRLAMGQAGMGSTYTLDSIAMVVIGGTSLIGGIGGMWRTAVGLLIFGVLTNVFDSLAIGLPAQLIVKGVVIAGAVAFDAYALTRTRTAGSSGLRMPRWFPQRREGAPSQAETEDQTQSMEIDE